MIPVTLEQALARKRPSKYVEFRKSFDPTSEAAWLRLIRDVVAISNSGGGWILIGVATGGIPSGADVRPALTLDSARVTEQVRSLAGGPFSGVEIVRAQKDGQAIAAIAVRGTAVPLALHAAVPLDVDSSRQRRSLPPSTVYFRHGARSRPGTTRDFQQLIERLVHALRAEWLERVRNVLEAPAGSRVEILPAEVVQSESPAALPIRVTVDPDAPAYRMVAPDATFPFRQKEVVAEVNRRVGNDVVNAYTILAVRQVFGIDTDSRYRYASRFGSPQYSRAFVDWLVAEYEKDSRFFERARATYTEGRRQR